MPANNPITFDTCADADLETIRPLITSLFAKETKLKNEVENSNLDPGPLTHQKYTIISDLCNHIRQWQDEFNNALNDSDADTEADTTKQAVIHFAKQLKEKIDDMKSDSDFETLALHRDEKKREAAKTTITVGIHASMFVPAAVVPSWTLLGVAAGASVTGVTDTITQPAKRALYWKMGLIGKQPESLQILNKLDEASGAIVSVANYEACGWRAYKAH